MQETAKFLFALMVKIALKFLSSKGRMFGKKTYFGWLLLFRLSNIGYCICPRSCALGARKKPGGGFLPAWWALTDSNRRPSACKADALNQLS